MSSFEEAQRTAKKAEMAAKRHAVEQRLWAKAEEEYDQEQSKQVLKEVEEAGGWEAWSKIQADHQEFIANNPPPLSPQTLEDMLEHYDPDPEEDEDDD